MSGIYNPWLVTLSILVAVCVSHTALSLASRVAFTQGTAARVWLIGGAVAMGVGIWSMHFIGMLAFSLPISLAYDLVLTLGSLGMAIAFCGYALATASRPQITLHQLAKSSAVLGLGICGMHYSGMGSIQIEPGIDYHLPTLFASVAIAVSASFAALWLFFRLRRGRSREIQIARFVASLIMGGAISGMHYTGMSAARFAANSYCLTGARLDSTWLAITIGGLSLGVLAITTILVIYDSHLDSKTRRHNAALEEANAQLHHAATHDPLTMLPNRALLADRLEQAIANAERHRSRFALLVVDLDRFKSVNDSLGHMAGDTMLREVARRLGRLLRKADTLARLGGDEFVLIVTEISGPHDVELVATKLQAAIAEPIPVSGVDLHISTSIGVSIFPDDAMDAAALLQSADAAMYHAKKVGRNTFQFFAPAMNSFARERLELESGLRRALQNGEFELHYQPKVDIATGRIESAEALIRWNHPERGLVAPNAFIGLAEDTGLILPIGEWVVREACQQLRAWHRAGHTHLRMAVNLSAQQFQQKNLVEMVQSALSEAHLEAHFLELELTETAVMHDAEQSVRVLERLSALGVRISVDDFGTGYSSLSYLRRLPLDKLKIDRAFIREIATSRDDAEIVRAIVSLAHSLQLKVIAEGVETSDQFDYVRGLGCDQFQGFLCSAPVPASDFVAALVNESRVGTSASARLKAIKVPSSTGVPPAGWLATT